MTKENNHSRHALIACRQAKIKIEARITNQLTSLQTVYQLLEVLQRNVVSTSSHNPSAN